MCPSAMSSLGPGDIAHIISLKKVMHEIAFKPGHWTRSSVSFHKLARSPSTVCTTLEFGSVKLWQCLAWEHWVRLLGSLPGDLARRLLESIDLKSAWKSHYKAAQLMSYLTRAILRLQNTSGLRPITAVRISPSK